jgi:hypothetical protein
MPSQAEVIQALRNASNGQDMAVPPPTSPADVVAGATPFANALGLPDALKALKGQLTPEEAQTFALTSAMGLLPGAKAETAVAKGVGSLAGKGTLTDLGKAAWQAAKANDFQPLARIGQQNVVPKTPYAGEPLADKLNEAFSHKDWEDAAKKMGVASTVKNPLPFPGAEKVGPGGVSSGHEVWDNLTQPEKDHILANYGDTKMSDLPSLVGKIGPELGQAYFKATKNPLSEEAINNMLAKNPGASIFDIAKTNIEGPSTPYSSSPLTSAMLKEKGYGSPDPETIPREGGVQQTPLKAKILGTSENLVHGTTIPSSRWETPTGGPVGTVADALRLPDDELGVHFGNPKQANVFTGNYLDNQSSPRQYPVVVATNNPLRLPDLGSWQSDRIVRALKKQGFPREELDNLGDIKDVRQYLTDKGYDSIVYKNSEEDPGHDSYIKFQPSPEAPDFVTGVRSPFAAFDPSKIMRPELAAGIGGAAALSPQGQEYIKALQSGSQQDQ